MALPKTTPNRTGSGTRTPSIVLLSMMAGLASVYGLRLYMTPAPPSGETPPAAVKPVYVTVPLASRLIPAGTRLTMDDVAIYKIPEAEVRQYSNGLAFMTNPTQIIGKTAKAEIAKGSIFTTGAFYPAGQRPGIATRLEKGLRAVTVSLTVDDALNGYASPGQVVDVLFHYEGQSTASASTATAPGGAGDLFGHHDFNPPRRRDYYGNTLGASGHGARSGGTDMQEATTTLAQGVRVLAVGTESVPTDAAMALPNPEERVSLTLAVTPRQAELLNVAKGHGRLSLTLRNDTDDDPVALLDPVTIDDIVRTDAKTHEMEIYRGQQLTRLHFTNGTTVQRQVFESDATLASDRKDATDERSLAAPHTTILPLLVTPGPVGGILPPGPASPPTASQGHSATDTLPVSRAVEVSP